MFQRLRSALRGFAWLVRAPGLRQSVRRLEEEPTRLAADLATQTDALARAGDRVEELLDRAREASGRKWPPGDLRHHEERIHSQNGEDGILREIFRRIGEETRMFVEFGVETGIECNCARLALSEAWGGLFLEADATDFAALEERYRDFPRIHCRNEKVASGNIEALLHAANIPEEFDLLSIDIDGNDYWVWNAIESWRPRVVVIEYNGAYPPPTRWVMKENPDHAWNEDTYYGASLMSLVSLGRRKGYTLVATDSTGVNAFFLRDDLVDDSFLAPMVGALWSPPNFGPHRGGHPPGSGPYLEI